MSEYQYYEFRAIDRSLTQSEMNELRRYSTRAEITPTGFTNEYNWGDFKGNPQLWMKEYFDAFLYFANWGTRMLHLKVPVSLFSPSTAREYCAGEFFSTEQQGDSLVIRIEQDGEGEDDFYEGSQWSLASFIPVRSELCRGDLRALYLVWLIGVQYEALDEDEIEPPVPPNLQQLSPALDTLADFLRLDRDLLAVAVKASPNLAGQPDLEKARSWISALPPETKDETLLRVMEGLEANVSSELWARMRRDPSWTKDSQVEALPRRSVGKLLEAADRAAEERRREEARKAAEAKARKQREEAKRRKQHLDTLVGREEEFWIEVDKLIAIRQAKPYAEAVNLLIDLCDLAKRASSSDFSLRLSALRMAHGNKPALLARLIEAGL